MTYARWTIREYGIIALVVFLFGSIFLWGIPNESTLGKLLVKPTIARVLRQYLIPLGLAQEWKMFAPNPANLSVYVTKRLEYRSGSGLIEVEDFYPTRLATSTPPQTVVIKPSYNGNGYRITAMSKFDWNMATDVLPHQRDSYLNYLCQTADQFGRRPSRVIFTVAETRVPLLAEAQAGAPPPWTTIPQAAVKDEQQCSEQP